MGDYERLLYKGGKACYVDPMCLLKRSWESECISAPAIFTWLSLPPPPPITSKRRVGEHFMGSILQLSLMKHIKWEQEDLIYRNWLLIPCFMSPTRVTFAQQMPLFLGCTLCFYRGFQNMPLQSEASLQHVSVGLQGKYGMLCRVFLT